VCTCVGSQQPTLSEVSMHPTAPNNRMHVPHPPSLIAHAHLQSSWILLFQNAEAPDRLRLGNSRTLQFLPPTAVTAPDRWNMLMQHVLPMGRRCCTEQSKKYMSIRECGHGMGRSSDTFVTTVRIVTVQVLFVFFLVYPARSDLRLSAEVLGFKHTLPDCTVAI